MCLRCFSGATTGSESAGADADVSSKPIPSHTNQPTENPFTSDKQGNPFGGGGGDSDAVPDWFKG